MQVPSLTEFLGDLESEDLARRADDLRALVDSPGWAVYQEMLEVQRAKLQVQQESRPLADVQTYAHGNGVLFGLRQGAEIVRKALAVADRQRKKLEVGAGSSDVGDGHD